MLLLSKHQMPNLQILLHPQELSMTCSETNQLPLLAKSQWVNLLLCLANSTRNNKTLIPQLCSLIHSEASKQAQECKQPARHNNSPWVVPTHSEISCQALLNSLLRCNNSRIHLLKSMEAASHNSFRPHNNSQLVILLISEVLICSLIM